MQIARTPNQLGAIIRRARKAAGWSQGLLGEKAGLWQETVSKVEAGQDSTRIATVLDLLAALQLEVAIQPRSKDAMRIEDIF